MIEAISLLFSSLSAPKNFLQWCFYECKQLLNRVLKTRVGSSKKKNRFISNREIFKSQAMVHWWIIENYCTCCVWGIFILLNLGMSLTKIQKSQAMINSQLLTAKKIFQYLTWVIKDEALSICKTYLFLMNSSYEPKPFFKVICTKRSPIKEKHFIVFC